MAIIGCIEDLQINERLFYSNKKFNPIVAAKSIWRLRRDAFSLDLLWSATSSSSKILPGCYGDRWPKTPTERSLLHPHQDLVRFVRLRRSRRWPGTSRSWPSRRSLPSQQTSLLQILNHKLEKFFVWKWIGFIWAGWRFHFCLVPVWILSFCDDERTGKELTKFHRWSLMLGLLTWNEFLS